MVYGDPGWAPSLGGAPEWSMWFGRVTGCALSFTGVAYICRISGCTTHLGVLVAQLSRPAEVLIGLYSWFRLQAGFHDWVGWLEAFLIVMILLERALAIQTPGGSTGSLLRTSEPSNPVPFSLFLMDLMWSSYYNFPCSNWDKREVGSVQDTGDVGCMSYPLFPPQEKSCTRS